MCRPTRLSFARCALKDYTGCCRRVCWRRRLTATAAIALQGNARCCGCRSTSRGRTVERPALSCSTTTSVRRVDARAAPSGRHRGAPCRTRLRCDLRSAVASEGPTPYPSGGYAACDGLLHRIVPGRTGGFTDRLGFRAFTAAHRVLARDTGEYRRRTVRSSSFCEAGYTVVEVPTRRVGPRGQDPRRRNRGQLLLLLIASSPQPTATIDDAP